MDIFSTYQLQQIKTFPTLRTLPRDEDDKQTFGQTVVSTFTYSLDFPWERRTIMIITHFLRKKIPLPLPIWRFSSRLVQRGHRISQQLNDTKESAESSPTRIVSFYKKLSLTQSVFMETGELVLSKQYIMSGPDFFGQHTEPCG